MLEAQPGGSPLPGAARLAKLLKERGMTRAAFARLASQHGAKVDRVTLGQMLDGHTTRVAVGVAVAIRRASASLGDEIPVEEWMPPPVDASRAA